MRFSRQSLTWTVVLALGALAWLWPLQALAGENVWTSDGSPGIAVTGIAMDPGDARTIYVASLGAIFKSIDGGATWTETWTEHGTEDPDLYRGVCLAVDPANPSYVYVGGQKDAEGVQGAVGTSHDAGATWSKIALDGFQEGSPVYSIAIEPATGSVYAADAYSTTTPLWRSTDAGNKWVPARLPTSHKPRRAYALLADKLHRTLLVGSDFTSVPYSWGEYTIWSWVGGGVARTTDGGGTWTMSPTDLGYPVTAFAVDSLGEFVYAGTLGGRIFRSGDGGVNWAPLSSLSGAVGSIVVDPSDTSTLYVGSGGVWRSSDRGATWQAFDSGLYSDLNRPRGPESLVIDPTGRRLYAGTSDGLFHRDISVVAAPGPCQPGVDHLCLLGSRFRVDLYAIDPRTQAQAPAAAIAQADRFGYFSFPTLTGDTSLPEVFVKMLDATSLPGQGYWVFFTALTDVPYSIAVTDTATGQIQLFDGHAFCSTADTQTFPPAASSAIVAGAIGANGALEASGVELRLLSRRFRITLAATDPRTGTPVSGVAIPQGDRFGYFSLPTLTGDSSFPEVFVKMLDATSLPDGDFWLFQSGLTTLPYTLTVTDSVTGTVKTYRNTTDPNDHSRLCGSADTRVTAGTVAPVLTGDSR